MCKVAGVAKIDDNNRTDVWLFMMVLGEYMSKHNEDGLGYAAFDKQGKIFGEKWLYNRAAFSDLAGLEGLTPEIHQRIYRFFGDEVKRDEAQSIILHTRMATCEKNIQNTHPFVNDIDNPTSVIIHNGVIRNDEQFKKKYSTCDSEVLVHLYDEHKVNADLINIRKVTRDLQGWYTVLGLATDPSGRMVMDVFTDSVRLNSFYVKELKTRVYCTSALDIRETAEEFQMTLENHWDIRPNSAHRIDVLTGEIINSVSTVESKKERKQLTNPDFRNNFFGRK